MMRAKLKRYLKNRGFRSTSWGYSGERKSGPPGTSMIVEGRGGDPQIKLRHLRDIMEIIFSVQEEDIDCDECGEHLDVYADKLRDGEPQISCLGQAAP